MRKISGFQFSIFNSFVLLTPGFNFNTMNYQETCQWMFAQLPMFQREGQAAYKANLDNTLQLDAHFNHPHRQFKTVHVAGTNGKGSVSHMLASILQEAGYKTGLYTSPHLKDFRERIKINGETIPENYVTDFIKENQNFFAAVHPSFFEMTVAMAFKYFADQEVDIAVIEVGLGGRLDSTNIITPLASVITNISFDHMDLLGNTLEQIATEKAGIIKPGIPVIAGTRDPAYDFVFEKKAGECQSSLSFASETWNIVQNPDESYSLSNQSGVLLEAIAPELKGHYQRKNIPTVVETAYTLQSQGLAIYEQDIRNGIACVIQNTGLHGRWEKLADTPLTICDTGHNIDGLTEVCRQLHTCTYRQLHFIIGMVRDKDIDTVLEILPRDAVYYFCKASIPRALEEHLLAQKAQKYHLQGQTFPTVAEAYAAARKNAAPEDMIYIGGSTYVVAEII